jgi:hypothetical protein
VTALRPPTPPLTPSRSSRADVRARVWCRGLVVTDRFGSLVCLVLRVWRPSWTQSLSTGQAASDGMSFVALGGRIDERGRATRARTYGRTPSITISMPQPPCAPKPPKRRYGCAVACMAYIIVVSHCQSVVSCPGSAVRSKTTCKKLFCTTRPACGLSPRPLRPQVSHPTHARRPSRGVWRDAVRRREETALSL